MKKNYVLLKEMVFDEELKYFVPVFQNVELFTSEVNKYYDLLFIDKNNTLTIKHKMSV